MAQATTATGTSVTISNSTTAASDTYTNVTEDTTGVVYFDVMANDGGGAKTVLWSLDGDGSTITTAGGVSFETDLITQDTTRSETATLDTSAFGAKIWITSDGKVGYDASTIDAVHKAQLQALGAGEHLNDTFTYAIRMANGTLSETTVTIQIQGLNDNSTVAGPLGLTTDEDHAPLSLDLLAGASDVDDNDVGTLHVTNLNVAGDTGGAVTVSLDGNSLAIDPSVYDSLGQGEHVEIDVTYKVADGHGGSVNQTATITIDGVNDNPTVGDPLSLITDEDQAASSLDLLTGASDVDDNDVGTLHVTNLSISGDPSGAVTQSGNSLDIDPSVYDHLGAGQSATVNVTYKVADGHGGSVDQSATITIDGVNDNPTVGDALSVTLGENDAATSLDLLSGASDVDDNDVGQLNVTDLNVTGDTGGAVTVSLDGNSLAIDPTAYDSLGQGEHVEIDVTYKVADGHGGSVDQSATITINGVNDNPTVGAPLSLPTDEDQAATSLNLLTGASDVDDNDQGQLHVANVTITNDPAGAVTQNGDSVDINPAVYDSLAAGESAIVHVTYDVIDAHGGSVGQSATITIAGVNDAPTDIQLSGNTIAEHATGTVGNLTSTDVDTSDGHTYSIVGGSAAGVLDSGYGLFAVSSGQLVVNTGIDVSPEQNTPFQVTIRTNDGHGGTFDKTFTITVTDDPSDNGPSVDSDTSHDYDVYDVNGVLEVTSQSQGGSHTFLGSINDDVIIATNDPLNGDTVNAKDGNDTIYGRAGNDLLQGFDNNDTIYAGSGNDTIIGGKGADDLWGGSGNDTFVYGATVDSTPAAFDTIHDFHHGFDKIDLHSVAAGLTFGGSSATANGIWFTTSGTETILHVDTNGNTANDEMTIHLSNNATVSASDFILS